MLNSIDTHQRAVHFLRGFEKKHYKEHKNNAYETMDFLLLTFPYSFIYVLMLSTILHHNKGIFLSFRTVLTSTIIKQKVYIFIWRFFNQVVICWL